jgi:prepilin peptidase CpaA
MPAIAVLTAGVIASFIDLRTRRIPNWLTFPTALAGISMAAVGTSGISLNASLLGFLTGALLMLPGHALGRTGAGDLKLLAAFGAVLGPERIVFAFLYMAIAGGLLAPFVAVRRGRFQTTVGRVAGLFITPATTRASVNSAGPANAFSYGPAIAIGCALAVIGRI